MQRVIRAPHRVPAMNATSRQTTAVMATAVAVDRLGSRVEEGGQKIKEHQWGLHCQADASTRLQTHALPCMALTQYCDTKYLY